MTGVDVVAAMNERGIRLYVDGAGTLRAHASQGALSDSDRAAIREHKAELVLLLTPRPGSVSIDRLPCVWDMVDRLDSLGRSLGLAPICIQSLFCCRLDQSNWASLGNGDWWRLDQLRTVDEDVERAYAKERARALSDTVTIPQTSPTPALPATVPSSTAPAGARAVTR